MAIKTASAATWPNAWDSSYSLESNPGLKSRFNKFIHFDDYSGAELGQIFKYMLDKAQYRPTKEAFREIEPAMQGLCQMAGAHFGNARAVRNLMEHVQQEQANRLSAVEEPTLDQLLTVEAIDIEAARSAILREPIALHH
jgi:hypothetical protein